jgi:23S rRNA U2552 (ribose-2'-O)-methylase RlmE/FtsJ
MSIFLLPKIAYDIQDEDIEFKMIDSTPDAFISNSLCEMLSRTKLQIEPIENSWDNYKKLTNPYEFIHTVVPGCKTQVSRMKPLSRSFYKMIEICTQFNLWKGEKCKSIITGHHDVNNDDVFFSHHLGGGKSNDGSNNNNCSNNNNGNSRNSHNAFMQFVTSPEESFLTPTHHSEPMSSFHLAEGPGGFIEAVCHMRNNPNDVYYGMTLVNNDSKCPGWKKSKNFLEENRNVIIEKGTDGTGNLLSVENFEYCYNKFYGTIDLITADGGVDFSENFNNQEHTATKLIIAQVVYAITMQSNGGNFVLKVFDIFLKSTVDVLYLLSSLYKEVYIMKPKTSRFANSEKYVVCKGFNMNKNYNKIIHKFHDNFYNFNSELNIQSFLKFQHDRTYLTRVEEINAIFGENQIENIIATLNLIMNKSSEKNENLKRSNIQKCIQWCEKHNISHYKVVQTVNIFLPL